MLSSDFAILALAGTHTITDGTWDPNVNAVSYQRAQVSVTSDAGDDLGESARAISEQVGRATNLNAIQPRTK